MCPPVIAALPAIGTWLTSTAGVLTTTLATTAVSLYAQNEQGKAQAERIGVQAEHEREEAGDAATEKLGVLVRESREKRSRARVAAGESGALGASFAASMNQSLDDFETDAALISKNLAFSDRSVTDRETSALANTRGVSALEAGLSIAGAGVGAYNKSIGLAARRKSSATGSKPR